MNTKTKIDAHKEILARLLATEGINVQHSHVDTAMFDLKNRTLFLPIWRRELSNDVYDLFIGHEVAHALWTSANEYKDALLSKKAPACYYNICEDARIERKIKIKYPGLKKNFFFGYKELNTSEHFGKGVEKRIPQMNLIDRINVYFKMGFFIDVPFADEEKDFLSRIDAAASFQTIRKIAEDIYEYSKDRQSETDTEGRELPGEETDGDRQFSDFDGEASDGDSDGNGDKKKGKGKKSNPANEGPGAPDDGKGKGSSKGSDDEDSDDENETKDSDVGGRDKHSRPHPGNFEDLDSETEKAGLESAKELVDKTADEWIYVRFGNYQYKHITEDFPEVYEYIKTEQKRIISDKGASEEILADLDMFVSSGKECLTDFKRDFAKSISHMAQTFEMKKRADEYRRQKESKTGILNPIKLHAYKYEDNIFKKNTTVAEGKNHGLIFFIDWSSSMASIINSTMKQLFCLTMFCKKVNIPFEVYAFSNNELCNGECNHPLDKINDTMDDRYVGVQGDFKLMNILSSRMCSREYNYAMEYLMSWSLATYTYWISEALTMSGTPLQGAIAVSENLIKDFQKKNRLQIVNAIYLTDGASAQDIGSFENGSVRGFGGSAFRSSGKNTIVVDDKTKKEYKMENSCNTQDWTELLIKILGDRVKCNIIGFNITSQAPGWVVNVTDKTNKEIRNKMRKDYFFGTTNTAYSDYYLVAPAGLNIKRTEINIKPGMTTRKMRSELIKQSASRKTNRILLDRFIEQII